MLFHLCFSRLDHFSILYLFTFSYIYVYYYLYIKVTCYILSNIINTFKHKSTLDMNV